MAKKDGKRAYMLHCFDRDPAEPNTLRRREPFHIKATGGVAGAVAMASDHLDGAVSFELWEGDRRVWTSAKD